MQETFRGHYCGISSRRQHKDSSCACARASADRSAHTSACDRPNAGSNSAAGSNLCQIFLLGPSRLVPKRIGANVLVYSASFDGDKTQSEMGATFNPSTLVRIGYLQRDVGTAGRNHNSVHHERIFKGCSYSFPRSVHACRNRAGSPNP
jgi:hypothetical protein